MRGLEHAAHAAHSAAGHAAGGGALLLGRVDDAGLGGEEELRRG